VRTKAVKGQMERSTSSIKLPSALERPRRIKCKVCAGTGKRIIHSLTVIPCRVCDGRGYQLARDLSKA
jgi:hypothetical protein